MNVIEIVPKAAGAEKSATIFGDKKAVAALADMRSTRWVELQMQKGMPHLKMGPRRVRFDLGEVADWLRQTYGAQRRGRKAVTA